jgi:uncharacterized protein GlcG (DUF336 family)
MALSELTLAAAQTIVTAALAHARREAVKPLAVVVLDGRGALKAAAAEDGTSLKRFEVAHGKAYGALALGMGSRSIQKRAEQQPYFVAAASHVTGGALVPAAGGVLIKDGDTVLGAIGISGDTSDNDEAAALAGISTAGLTGQPD